MSLEFAGNNKASIKILFPKRLDTSNVDDFRNELEASEETRNLFEKASDSEKMDSVVLDMENTEYISSAGLRLIMLIRKYNVNTSMINVCSEVYDILEMTGFSSVLQVKRKAMRIDRIDREPIARGSNGEIYALEDDTIVKMFTSRTSMEAIEEEWKNAKTAFSLGIPSVICYAMVTDGERMGIMFERMQTTSLDTLIYSDYEHFDLYAERFADLLMELHGTHDSGHELHEVRELFYSLLGQVDYLTQEEKDEMNAFLKSVPDSDRVVHGDFHPRNIGEAQGELILMDMAEISHGHPIFDFLSTYYDLVFSGKTVGRDHPEITKKYFGLEVPELRKLWDITLRYYFRGLTDEEADYINETMDMLTGMKIILFPVLHPNFSQEKLDAWIRLGREHFLSHISELPERLKRFDEIYERSGL